jgi:crotonobetainyl-CoA:carnitine CoA-transferase CaiB-like acyl-CoA transferase
MPVDDDVDPTATGAGRASQKGPTALGGLRVVDLSGALAGALTGMVLCDNGAEVVKVEPPGGDALRQLPGAAAWYRGKLSVVADLSTTAGRERVRELALGADVVVQDWRPGVAERLGLAHEQLAPGNPGLITCAITGFGPAGPWAGLKGYEAVVAAKTGVFSTPPGSLSTVTRPRFSPLAAGSFGAAMGALQGVLAALYSRGPDGPGQRVSIAVDTGTPEGMEVLHRLVARADLAMRNFRQGATERMGVDAESLRAVNPNLFYLYAAAYGSSGPSVARPAYAPTIGAGVGHQALQLGWTTAFDGVPALTVDEALRRGQQAAEGQAHPLVNADAGAALTVGTAMLLGLVARQRTGRAQSAQTTMLCSNAYVVSADFLGLPGATGTHRLPDAEGTGLGALYRLYPADGGWLFPAVTDEEEWSALCSGLAEATGATLDLAVDAGFGTSELRDPHDAELGVELAGVFAGRPAARWEELLTARDVSCVEVNEQPFSEFMMQHPAMRENGFVGEVEHPLFGRHVRHGAIVTMPDQPATLGPGCLIGQHTRQILRELGYSEEQIVDLRARNAVTWPGEPDPAAPPGGPPAATDLPAAGAGAPRA